MSELLEVFMLLCFGVSWPISIRKSIVSRTAKGKSLVFECFVFAGYLCGIASKLISQNISYVVIFYNNKPRDGVHRHNAVFAEPQVDAQGKRD